MEKRVCLLAGFDKNNIIQDYVVFLVQELSKISDVYYFADGEMNEKELSKIKPYAQYAEAAPHKGFDFGSWQYLIHHIGWKSLAEYDEMILCNDSIYGPMTNMNDIFDYMELRGYDFWGLTENYNSQYHLDSYFMVFNNKVIQNQKFHQFWQNITPGFSRKTYETVLTPFLIEQGFVGNSFIKNYKKEDQLAYPMRLLKQNNMPFIRVKALRDPMYNLKEPVFFIDSRIKFKSGYDTSMIKKHLLSADSYNGFGFGYYMKNAVDNIKTKIDNFIPKI